MSKAEPLTIKQAAAQLGCDAMYVRQLLKKGHLVEAGRERIGNSDVMRVLVDRGSIESYGEKFRIRDTRRTYKIHCTPEVAQAIASAYNVGLMDVTAKMAAYRKSKAEAVTESHEETEPEQEDRIVGEIVAAARSVAGK